jgi:chorismate lyase/3-hydroxybenzoate synthase
MSFFYASVEQNLVHNVDIPLEVIAKSAAYAEFWEDGTEVNLDFEQEVTKISTPSHLVLIFDSEQLDISGLTRFVYSNAYQISQQQGYTHLLRTWNYIHNINGYKNNMERYQEFCVARHEVLEQYQQLDVANPAATAIGSMNGKNNFVFLFSRQPGQVIENKRQVSAWQYPVKYAPKQPRFSRAMLLEGMLMCSGTASVVGHETVHIDDIKGQFFECLNNVNQLIQSSQQAIDFRTGVYRFYLRDKHSADLLESLIIDQGIEHFIILQGDICRENLLLECEVVFQT